MRYPAGAGREARSRAGLPALVVLVLLAGCGTAAPGPGGVPGPAESCLAVPAAGEEVLPGGAGDPLEVGLSRPVDPAAAPVPRHADEAFLFRLLYEPLVRLDCEGRPYPALAGSWSSDDRGRRWSFELREDARFWDGRPVRAADVAASWSRAERAGREPWRGAPPVSVVVEDERRITVRFPRSRDDALSLFARSELAVVHASKGPGWPVTGTGPYRVAEAPPVLAGAVGAAPVADGSTLLLVPAGTPGAADLPSRLRFRVATTGDPRDLLDAGVDLVVTDDPSTLEYARLRPDLSTRPLPWNRTYVLAVRAGVATAGEGERGASAEFLAELASDAVRVEARAAEGRGGVVTDGGLTHDRCLRSGASNSPRSGGAVPASPDVVAYPRGDATARALAERLVALAAASRGGAGPEPSRTVRALGLGRTGGAPVTAPVEPGDLPEVLRTAFGEAPSGPGTDRAGGFSPDREPAYVVGTGGARQPAACSGPAGRDRRSARGTAAPGGGWRLVPLIETRRRVVHRPLAAAVAVDADGTPYFRAPRRR